MKILHHITLASFLMILSIFHFSLASDTMSPTNPISDGETLISSLQSFELGLFTPKNSKNRYLGIWYKKIPDTVVWVANRDKPINDSSGVLAISKDGNLVLLNQAKQVVWSSNISGAAENPVAQLLDTGNFVIRSNNSVNSDEGYIWQSFDYPSDTMLPGMKLGWNLRTGLETYLMSWRRSDDPSPGDYTYKLDIYGLPQLVIRSESVKVSRTGMWNGLFFGVNTVVSYMAFKPIMVFNSNEMTYKYEPINNGMIMRLTLNESGFLQRLLWNNENPGWVTLYTVPSDLCDIYGRCGVNGICSTGNKPICECLNGFVPQSPKEWRVHNWTSGCVRSTPLDCQMGDGFVKIERVKLPDLVDYRLNKSMNLADCEAECSKNCSCTAYSNPNISDGGSGCLMWFGDLVDMKLATAELTGQDIYLRLPASDSESDGTSSTKSRRKIIITVSTAMGVLFSLVLCCIIWKSRRKRIACRTNKEDLELPLFNFNTIASATRNFSYTNKIGEGGFGPVYKGKLLMGQEIAVKRLSRNSGQGLEEFKNEVKMIAKLQHRNLVRLLGCCIEGDERMLIYEYMPNKSLDYIIFDQNRKGSLDWPKCFDVIIGIARGLLYLHQDSRLRIIHRDLKTSNILLDVELNPKISDFGIARIVGRDQIVAKTKRVVGTYGYMSPEYAIDGKFSIKSDIFSFGVVLLEIVSGKKNRSFQHPNHHHNLLGHAWLLWNEEKALELMDPCWSETCIECQVLRCIQVGLLCVQKFPQDRPDMSAVLFMLSNEGITLPQPKQPGFFGERNSVENKECHTEIAITMTTLEAR